MKNTLKHIVINIVVFLSASAIFVIFIFYTLCCLPYHAFITIRNAYREDREASKMYRDIELFLREQKA